MTNLLYYEHYYRYRRKRKNIESDVNNTNYSQAKTQIDNDVSEHESFYTNPNIRDFNFGEHNILKQIQTKLGKIIQTNDSTVWIDGDLIGNPTPIKLSDRVKFLINYQPKADYTDPDN